MSLLSVLKLIWFIEGTLDVPVNLIKLLKNTTKKLFNVLNMISTFYRKGGKRVPSPAKSPAAKKAKTVEVVVVASPVTPKPAR